MNLKRSKLNPRHIAVDSTLHTFRPRFFHKFMMASADASNSRELERERREEEKKKRPEVTIPVMCEYYLILKYVGSAL